MSLVPVIIFVSILFMAIVLYFLLLKSKKKKGPLVSGEEAMDAAVNNFDA